MGILLRVYTTKVGVHQMTPAEILALSDAELNRKCAELEGWKWAKLVYGDESPVFRLCRNKYMAGTVVEWDIEGPSDTDAAQANILPRYTTSFDDAFRIQTLAIEKNETNFVYTLHHLVTGDINTNEWDRLPSDEVSKMLQATPRKICEASLIALGVEG